MSNADLQCLGGGKLLGHKPVRYIYLDESGVGDIRREPHVVVAGVVLYPDDHWRQATALLRRHVHDAVGAKRAPEFICHAKELWSGSKKCGLNKDEGRALLKQIVSIPRDMNLQIVWGSADRVATAAKFKRAPAKVLEIAHAAAFGACLVNAERLMRTTVKDGEIAQVVAENTDRRTALKQMFRDLGPGGARMQAVKQLLDSNPLNHLVDMVHFAEKREASLLQIADACAYAIRGRLAGRQECAHLFDIIRLEMRPTPKKLPSLAAPRA